MSTSVFVTGATGYIAQHIIKLLLSKGYAVVGSVRSSEKGEHLREVFSSDKFSYEVVPLLTPVGAFDEALEKHPEVTVFLHTASPVTFEVEDIEKDLLNPAVEGTLNVLKAIKAHGSQIKKVVITSSVAAQVHPGQMADPKTQISEDTWNSISWEESKANPLFGYFGSKKFAEKAAWDFYNEEKPQYALNTINPAFVFGPQAYDSEVSPQLNFSSEVVAGLLKLTPESEVPPMAGWFIDVRDVAKAHLAAFENDWKNQRLLLHSGDFSSQSILDIINANFASLKDKLPVGNPGLPVEVSKVDNKKTREALGFSFVDLPTSVNDTISQVLAARERANLA
ncbi:NAD(P)-binding protein [Metschnikowia bicuspidata var. bicuspidata NRRL YB-4993]|uniref:NAD(P)-binding protein n=1 Tax=Metschnikowia bicuspidata var. bicuspidata NRRL YB-4993 TaxID=869754 RepID=A0A1A0HBF3_9ASCO|nr:NAD(P)-binding protein [Metschnikowia bicuspidata var. bicuspidata NRRL YB-4993]OBA21341.1 NAD(P)-binding protein [Metschnikowia bicuspidata var. bicuspidata NRRL YB-4993]